MSELQIAKLVAAPGDTIVVRIAHRLSQDDVAHVRAMIAPSLPQGVKILVLDADAELSVFSAPMSAAMQSNSQALRKRGKGY
jgi:hypothetical protein